MTMMNQRRKIHFSPSISRNMGGSEYSLPCAIPSCQELDTTIFIRWCEPTKEFSSLSNASSTSTVVLRPSAFTILTHIRQLIRRTHFKWSINRESHLLETWITYSNWNRRKRKRMKPEPNLKRRRVKTQILRKIIKLRRWQRTLKRSMKFWLIMISLNN